MGDTIQLGAGSLRNVSKEQAVYDLVKRAIISGELSPGQRLLPMEIGQQLGVSSMPVRNALMRLEAERFISRTPHREYVVTLFSKKEIQDLYSVRSLLEGFAGRVATEKMSAETLAELRRSLDRAERLWPLGPSDDLIASNREFHTILYRQTGNDGLVRLIDAQRDLSNRYQDTFYFVRKTPEQTVREHRDILRAVERGDAGAVESLIREGIESNCREMLRLMALDTPSE